MLAFCVLLALLVAGVPLAFSIGLAATAYVAMSDFPISLVAQRIFNGIDSFAILAIPLFVLAGELMNACGITHRIIKVANSAVGHLKCGLGHVNIWSSVIFAGLSGSAIADTSALGRVFIPTMEKEGYSRSFAAALTAASAVIGPIIPPSIPVIIFALITPNVSVPALFLAGVGPGLLLATALSLYLIFFGPKGVRRHPKLSLWKRLVAIKDGIIPIFMPVFIVTSIVTGVVTPTEAAALAVLYALIVGLFILRTLKLSDLPTIFMQSMRDSSTLLIIIAVVALGNWLLTMAQIPQVISEFFVGNVSSAWGFLLLVNLLLLLIGMVLEGLSAMLVIVPILMPIAYKFGIDPTHFGLIVVLNICMGVITPPMGLCLFVADNIAHVGVTAITKAIIPMFIAEVVVLLTISYVPITVLWLPRLLGF